MFEVGRNYEIRRIIGGEEGTTWGKIEKYEHPLIKLADVVTPEGDPYFPAGTVPGEIINVTSPNFISAVLKHN